LMATGRNVQIMLNTTSPLELVFSSIREWQKKNSKEGENDPQFSFILPSSAATMVQSVHAPHVITSPLADAVLVWNRKTDVAADQDITMALAKSEQVFQGFDTDVVADYVIKTGLYGSLLSDEDHHIYTFGTAWEFQGIVSTIPDLQIMKRKPNDVYYLAKAVVATKAIGADRAEAWYELVKSHCTLMLSAPYRCPIYASEVCNLISAQRERIKMKFSVTGDVEFVTLMSDDEMSALSGFDTEKKVPAKERRGLADVMRGKGSVKKAPSGGDIEIRSLANANQVVDIAQPEQRIADTNNTNVVGSEKEATTTLTEEDEGDAKQAAVAASLLQEQAGEY